MIIPDLTFSLRSFLTKGEKLPDLYLFERRLSFELEKAPKTGVDIYLEVVNFRPDPALLGWVRPHDTIHIRTDSVATAMEWHAHLTAAQRGEHL